MHFRWRPFLLIVLLLLGLASLWSRLHRYSPSGQAVQTGQVRKYKEQLRRLKTLLHELDRQVQLSREGYVIQNSLLELRQEWLLTDVIAGSTRNPTLQAQHRPADSLQTLYNLCFPTYDTQKRAAILQEINLLKKWMDTAN
ncbi:hypothetical protein ACO2Q8_06635 [Larkinella sp. VNQ87]|uniref:hypothetical protein n=1 Tax=Larkinella sp. VNQ87 TaxID=3400921 RepID=UPI003BFBD58F